MKCEDRSQEETERQQRCTRGACRLARNFYKFKKKGQGCILFANRRVDYAGRIHQKTRKKESLWKIPGASMHMVSERDLNSAELETMRISKNMTSVMTANGEVQTRHGICKRIVLNRDSDASRRYTSSSSTLKTMRRSWENLPLDQWSKTTSHPKMAKESIAI